MTVARDRGFSTPSQITAISRYSGAIRYSVYDLASLKLLIFGNAGKPPQGFQRPLPALRGWNCGVGCGCSVVIGGGSEAVLALASPEAFELRFYRVLETLKIAPLRGWAWACNPGTSGIRRAPRLQGGRRHRPPRHLPPPLPPSPLRTTWASNLFSTSNSSWHIGRSVGGFRAFLVLISYSDGRDGCGRCLGM